MNRGDFAMRFDIILLCALVASFTGRCSGCDAVAGLAGDAYTDGQLEGGDAGDLPVDGVDGAWDDEDVGNDGAANDAASDIDQPFDSGEDDSPQSPCCSVVGDPVVVDEVNYLSGLPMIQWTGNNYGIAWFPSFETSQIFFRFLSVDGELEGEAASDAPMPGYHLQGGDMKWNGSLFGISFSAGAEGVQPQVGLKLVDVEGRFVDGVALSEPREDMGGTVKVEWDGDMFAIAFLGGYYSGGNEAVHFTRITDAYEMLDQPYPVAYISPDFVTLWAPEFVWVGDRHIFFFPFENLIFTISTDEEGHMIHYPFAFFAGTMNEEVIINACRDGEGAAAVFHFQETGKLRFKRTGAAMDASVVAETEPTSVTVDWTGSDYGICWCSEGKPWFGMVDPRGRLLGSNIVAYDGTDECNGCYTAWSVSEFGLVWFGRGTDGIYRVYAARISPAGG
jgi:hypothetical protein